MRLFQTGAVGTVAAIALVALVGLDNRVFTGTSAQAQKPDEQSGRLKPCIVFNITSGKDDLHALTMALQLAGHALDDGREVVLFMNVRATELARKDASPTLAFRENPPLQTMLKKLMERGAKMLVCPHCMKVQGVEPADLLPGAEVASRETLFGNLGPNAHVFSY
jgi:predicted peroxiredoxin